MSPSESRGENIYKIYACSFVGPEQIQRLLQEAQPIVDAAILPAPPPRRSIIPKGNDV